MLPLLLFSALLATETSSVKMITTDDRQSVIVYSEPNAKGNWIYRNALLSSGYFFSIIDDDKINAYSRQQNYVHLSALVAPAKDLTRFAAPIPSGTEVLFTDKKECKERSCLHRRGHVVRALAGNYYEIHASSCQSIQATSGRNDRLVSRTAVESKNFIRHVTQILSYTDYGEPLWRQLICYGKDYAEKTRMYEIAVRLDDTEFHGCSKYKLTHAILVPKIQLLIEQRTGETPRLPEYRRIPDQLNEIVLDTGNDIEHSDLTKESKVLVRDPRDPYVWKLGMPTLIGHTIQVQLEQTHQYHETQEVHMNDLREEVRPLKYRVAPMCDDEIRAITSTERPTADTPSQNNLVIPIAVTGVVILCLLLIVLLIFVIRRWRKARETSRLRAIMRARQISHGVRDVLNVDFNQRYVVI